MSTFDGWETRLFGDAMASSGYFSENELMHFRTKGSKNGVRRYQQPDGTWTPLGLKERKAREGWGESKNERKAAKLQKRLERRTARKERLANAKEARIQRRAKKNIKNLSDNELQQRINRIKKEIEYKELTRNPVIKTAEKFVTSYFNNKEKKLEREAKRAEIEIRKQETKQKLIAAKAALTSARGGIIDNLTGGAKRKQAKEKLISTKADKTVRGAIRKAIGGVITKEGNRIVNDMGEHSLVMRGGRKVKSAVNKSRDKTVEYLKRAYAQDQEAIAKQQKRKALKKDRKQSRSIGSQLRG